MNVFERLLPGKRVVLVEPPFFRIFGYKRWHYPFTLVLVGTYLEELGHEVCVLDLDKPTENCKEYSRKEAGDNYYLYDEALKDPGHPVWVDALDRLVELKPDIVCIAQSISAKADSADIIAKMVKKHFGDKVLTVLGGTHINSMLSLYPNYDFGASYDEVVTHIPRLIDRKPNKRLLVDYDSYSPRDFSSIWTSSGCPNSCTFCCYSTKRKVTFRNIESIREEIGEINEKYGNSQVIYFIDDSFLSYPKRFYDITSIVKEYGMAFKAGGRVMDLTVKKIDKFIQNGGSQVYIGIESGSQKILDKIQKRVTVDEIKKRTKWLNEAGLPWSAFFIVGFPFETLEDLRMTKQLIEEVQPTLISLNRFTPYPGTKIYKDYYMGKKIQLKDLFQQNRIDYSNASNEIHDYIEYLFQFVDEYNQKNAVDTNRIISVAKMT